MRDIESSKYLESRETYGGIGRTGRDNDQARDAFFTGLTDLNI